MANKAFYRHRPIKREDAAMILNWRNQESIRRFMYSDHIIGEEEHAGWMNRILAEADNYRIFEYEGTPIGVASLYDIKVEHGRCYWAFYLGESNAPRGSGSAMEFLMLDYVFLERGFRKLCCEVFCFNEKVVSLHKKFGFTQESLFRGHYFKNGRYEDVVGLALFKHEWRAFREEMHRKLFGEQNQA